MKTPRNPISGYGCTGFRAMFRVPDIDPHTLYIPIEMKELPKIRQLMHGGSPLSVFNTNSFSEARKKFRALRKKYDFDYWALKEYPIHDVNNPDSIITLRLNDAQHHVIDILRKRYTEKKLGRYIISKSIPHCGLTTCIQAFFLWMQLHQCSNNSYLCGPSDIALSPFRKNLCRHLRCDIIRPDSWIFIPKADSKAFYFTFRSPDAIRGINLGYVHLADMSRWRDPKNALSPRAHIACVSAVLLDFFTFVVLEGDVPRKNRFSIKDCIRQFPSESQRLKIIKLSSRFNNPFFINEVMVAQSNPNAHYFHIHISSSFRQ